MKKLIWTLMMAGAAITFSCGDGTNRSSERGDDTEDADNTEQVEPDTSATGIDGRMESDSTSLDERNRENNRDSIR